MGVFMENKSKQYMEEKHNYSELFLDIETIPSGERIDPLNLPYPSGMSVQKTIDTWYIEKAPQAAEEEYRKRALNSMKGQLLCIGYAFDMEKPQVVKGTEAEIIKEFDLIIKGIPIEVK